MTSSAAGLAGAAAGAVCAESAAVPASQAAGAFVDVEFAECPLVEGLHFHGGFVRLDFGEDVADFHLVALFFAPLDQRALEHRIAQLGHGDDGHKGE